jgi:glycosyltransferase involved in cell wall biosynthesis
MGITIILYRDVMKFAIISPVLPPSPSGQAIVLFRLLKNIDPEQFILISPKRYNRINKKKQNSSEKLGSKYYHVTHFFYSVETLLVKADRLGFGLLLELYLKIRTMIFVLILKREGCVCVVGCPADLFDPYCSSNACKKLNIPFIFYAFDDYIAQFHNQNDLYFSHKYGPEILRSAEKIIVPNEFLRDYYYNRYKIDATVIRNPVNLDDYEDDHEMSNAVSEEPDKEVSIVYTGAIYEAHYDAFTHLVKAIENLSGLNIVFHIYSDHELPQEIEPKKNHIVYHKHQPYYSMPCIQKEADVLFLPLAFNTAYENHVIATSSPGKIGEYLAAKRPILVHSPSNSFVSWYFKKYNCGVVAELEDVSDLTEKLFQIITNQSLKNEIIKNAWDRATEDFDGKKKELQFIDLLHDYMPIVTNGELLVQ